MSSRLKKILLLLVCLIFSILVLAGCEDANTAKILYPNIKENVFVYDQGEFLDDTIEVTANNLLDSLENQTTIEFAIITIPSLEGLSIEKYSIELANGLGIGKESSDNGILLLISKSDGKVRLEIGDGLQGILTDSACGRILDNYFVPNRKNDDYDTAFFDTIQAVINYLDESDDYDIQIESLDRSITVEQDKSEVEAILEFLAIIIIAIVVILLIEWITGHIAGGGFGDGIISEIIDSSSSYSGSSRSGGSGGFGGGHFSGGGASR